MRAAVVAVGMLMACVVPLSCSSQDRMSRCEWRPQERELRTAQFAGIDDAIAAAATSAGLAADDVYDRATEEESVNLWPTPCLVRSVGVPGLLSRVLVFDDIESLDSYIQRDSFPAVEDGFVDVRTGELPSVAETAVHDVHGVAGANLYCLYMTDCNSWILTRTFEECADVVVDLRYWVGTPSTTADVAADVLLGVSDSLAQSLRDMGFCTPADTQLPEYRGS